MVILRGREVTVEEKRIDCGPVHSGRPCGLRGEMTKQNFTSIVALDASRNC